jgi:hypothetical protein
MCGDMRAVKAAAVLAVAALAVAGCGDSHKKVAHSGPSRAAFLRRALQVARASNSELANFPPGYGHGECSIPRALGGIHASVAPLRGTCRTRWETAIDSHEPKAVVIFTERWRWPPCLPGEDCVAGGRLLRHAWTVTVERPVAAGQRPSILATQQTGAQAPQAPKP